MQPIDSQYRSLFKNRRRFGAGALAGYRGAGARFGGVGLEAGGWRELKLADRPLKIWNVYQAEKEKLILVLLSRRLSDARFEARTFTGRPHHA